MSEPRDGGRQIDRRTYLKGLAAVGLASSLAGCSVGTFTSSVIGLDPEWAKSFGYVEADYRKAETSYTQKVDTEVFDGEVSATAVTQAVTYTNESKVQDELIPTYGVLTTPIPKPFGRDLDLNPYAKTTIEQIFDDPQKTRPLLDGLGFEVGSSLNWVDGPIHDPLGASDVQVLGSPAIESVYTRGVFRSGDTFTQMWIICVRAVLEDPAEVVFLGSSLWREVEEGAYFADLKQEDKTQLFLIYIHSLNNIKKIDPATDLEGFA